MIETVMYVALGFLLASLVALLLAPPLWRRAVRLTTRKLESTMPMSLADIQADKDQLRAEFAIKYRQLEIALNKAKDKAARHLVERNRSQARNAELKAEVKAQKAELAERASEVTVLEQTVKAKIPDLEAQLGRAREIIMSRDREIHQLKSAQATRSRASTSRARQAAGRQADVDLDGGPGDGGRVQARGRRGGKVTAKEAAQLLAENQRLEAELSRLVQQHSALEQSSAREKETLKAEMKALADQIMQAIPAAKPAARPEPPKRPRPAAAAAVAAAPVLAADEIRAPKPSRRSRAKAEPAKPRARPDRKPRRSLTDRLKALASSDSE